MSDVMATAELYERELIVPATGSKTNLRRRLCQAVTQQLQPDEVPMRLAVTGRVRIPASDQEGYHCEVGLLRGLEGKRRAASIFHLNRRPVENAQQFTAVLLVPTGVGAEIGGHAGDAMPVAALLASVCDTLITHPNVLNASDVIEMPANALYVEGSVIARLLQGQVGLQRVRNNRLLVVLGPHDDELFIHAAINSVNAARASYGLFQPQILWLEQGLQMDSRYARSGRAAGLVRGLEPLFAELDRRQNEYDAVAITSQIGVPAGHHFEYFDRMGDMVNPWGGVEAMLTHAISALYDVPSAHAPMLENREIANADPGVVDPRMAAEAVSLAMIQCILKGLQRSPRLVTDPDARRHHSVLNAADVSCLVIPDGCVGLPTLAALEQGISTIAVRENRNLMSNDLTELPWAPGQLHIVENYWEAAGVMAALRAGVDPAAVRRPLVGAAVTGLREQAGSG